MTVKLLCAVLIVFACSAIGIKLSNSMAMRVRSLGGFLSATDKIENSIATIRMPLEEIYAELSKTKGKIGQFFSEVTPGCDWKKQLGKFPELTGQDKEIIVKMSEKLGEFESERQLKELEFAKNSLEEALMGAKTDMTTNSRVYRSMSFFAGIVIAILLV